MESERMAPAESPDEVSATSIEIDTVGRNSTPNETPRTALIESNHRREPSLGSGASNSGQKETPFIKVVERNAYYLKEQLEQFFASRTGPGASVFVPIVCGSILLLYLINVLTRPTIKEENNHKDETDPAFDENAPVLVQLFTLTPGHILSPRYWFWSAVSMLTYPFIELYFYQVVIDVIVVSLSTTLIDPLWGKKELVTYFMAINLSVGILAMAHYVIIYAVKGDAVYLYGVKIYGLTGYLAVSTMSIL